MRVRFYSRTDPGRRRKINEDAFACSDDDGFCILCDGMGGHTSGEVASRLAVQILAARARLTIPRVEAPRPEREASRVRALLPALVAEWIRDANAAIFERGATERDPTGAGRRMGTTIALLCIVENFAVAAHIGDSRIYRLRAGAIEPLTRDHSVLSADLAPSAERRKRKYITRALGTRPEVRADLMTLDVAPGDRFVVCTDGLTDLVRDDEIRLAVEEAGKRLDAVPALLVGLANERGGRDNVTVIVGELEGLAAAAPLVVAAPEVRLAVTRPAVEPIAAHPGSRGGPALDVSAAEADSPPPPPPLEPPPPWAPDE
jgi:protein phosphatase